jgi:aspartyl-tRNA(Asn)/glutamyl-tRNA(Gln) amidotransferase subunit C
MAEIDVAYVARLARIALTSEEVVQFGGQLEALLDHVAQLEALPTADVAATAAVIPSSNVMRDDVPVPSLARETVLSQAPRRQGNYFQVPRIITEE